MNRIESLSSSVKINNNEFPKGDLAFDVSGDIVSIFRYNNVIVSDSYFNYMDDSNLPYQSLEDLIVDLRVNLF